jgi:anthranilate phosphoribosyltransferase
VCILAATMSDFSWPDTLARLLRKEHLGEAEAAAAMRQIMDGAATPSQIAAFLVALRTKGETVEEITGLAGVMRERCDKVEVEGTVIDTCGTGGDRAGTVNISTMAAIVCTGAGATVAKHGNRAASSRCGSADLLEALGVVIDLDPAGVQACIEETGIGFCFAPVFHPSMRHAGPTRRELGIPTVFNFLGPLTNPAGAKRQTVGVSDQAMAPKMAEALVRLGAEHAFVFRGDDGLDELTTATTSRLWDITPNGATERGFDPAEVGIARSVAGDLAGADAATNAKVCESVLAGDDGPIRDAVALNAAAALVAGGIAKDFAEGLTKARASIDSGRAASALKRLRDVSMKLKP